MEAEKMTAVINQKDPQHVLLELDGGKEGLIKKKILLKNFLKLLSGAVAEEQKGFTLGKLPSGYYNARVTDEDTFKVILSVPAGTFPFQYFDSTYSIPFPKLVFMVSCVEGKVEYVYCFAATDEVLTTESVLYHYPFSNVYENGKICFGRNEIPRCSKMSDVDDIVQLFYGAPSNNDLWNVKYVGNKYPALRLLLEDLNGKDTFPTELLSKTSHRVIGDLL